MNSDILLEALSKADFHGLGDEKMRRATEGMILTEWKLAKNKKSDVAAGEAIAQAERYAAGALAGFELASIRYIIVVSEKDVPPLDDKRIKDVTYRHINVAVVPDAPSVSSKSSAPRGTSAP